MQLFQYKLRINEFPFNSRGVKAVDKKEGSGSHNWGTFEDEMKAEEDKANISADGMNESGVEADVKETNAAPVTTTTTTEDEEAAARKAAEEEEAKLMTLDEWKAQKAKKDGPKFNLRKAGEGSDIDPKWKKTYAYKKEKETHEDDEDEVCLHKLLENLHEILSFL